MIVGKDVWKPYSFACFLLLIYPFMVAMGHMPLPLLGIAMISRWEGVSDTQTWTGILDVDIWKGIRDSIWVCPKTLDGSEDEFNHDGFLPWIWSREDWRDWDRFYMILMVESWCLIPFQLMGYNPYLRKGSMVLGILISTRWAFDSVSLWIYDRKKEMSLWLCFLGDLW